MTRRRSAPGGVGVQLGLIITPMLDMAFQILAFFIMTYNPSALEAHIPGALAAEPAVKDAHHPILDPLPADAELLDGLKDAPTVQIKAVLRGQEAGNRVEGSIAQIFVKQPLDVQPELVADVDVDLEAALKKLQSRLAEIAKNGDGKQNLRIAADGELRQQYVLKVYDASRKAGFASISFVPPRRNAK